MLRAGALGWMAPYLEAIKEVEGQVGDLSFHPQKPGMVLNTQL